MAEITAVLHGIDGKTLNIDKPLKMELASDMDAACDGLRLYFLQNGITPETDRVTVFIDKNKVFDGVCDRQEYQRTNDGVLTFIYARSGAAVLVDNEANPATYIKPSTQVLFHEEAKKYSFKNMLPDLASAHEYSVEKGTSCYGAINQFVKTSTGLPVRVTCNGELRIPAAGEIINLESETIISEKHCINRSAPITQIDYKISNDSPYIRHFKSRTLEKNGISRARKINIASLPEWQREYTLYDRLKKAAGEYYSAEFVIDGAHSFELYSKLVCKPSGITDCDGYRLWRSVISHGESGDITRLTFLKETDLKEVNYVAE